MAIDNCRPEPVGETRSATSSRRHALALMLGACRWLPGAPAAADPGAPVRIAISESTVADVNLDDARAAMLIWIKRVMLDWNVTIELDPKVFDTTEEILRRARRGQVDSVAVNLLEYRQIADVLDTTQIIIEAGDSGPDLCILAAKRGGGIQHLSDLRGRRLCTWKAPRMCIAPAWLTATLDEEHLGPSEQFFASVTTETKVARVVLPVFFGQADACLTSKRSFDTMCELNPQVAKDLTAIATSPVMVPLFYCFHKNYHSADRERFVKALTGLRASVAGRQIATLFQCNGLTTADASCLAAGLGVLDRAERARGRPAAGGRKG